MGGNDASWIFVFFFVGFQSFVLGNLSQGKLTVCIWRNCNMALLLDFQVGDDR